MYGITPGITRGAVRNNLGQNHWSISTSLAPMRNLEKKVYLHLLVVQACLRIKVTQTKQNKTKRQGTSLFEKVYIALSVSLSGLVAHLTLRWEFADSAHYMAETGTRAECAARQTLTVTPEWTSTLRWMGPFCEAATEWIRQIITKKIVFQLPGAMSCHLPAITAIFPYLSSRSSARSGWCGDLRLYIPPPAVHIGLDSSGRVHVFFFLITKC